jgi:hypothetical protein
VDYERLETEEVSAYYDEEQQIAFITYKEVVTRAATEQAYAWALRNFPLTDVSKARGSIDDFRQVKRFAVGNLGAVQKNNFQVSRSGHFDNHPVALLVETHMQEMSVRTVMLITIGEERKRVVRTVEEAFQFFDEFHAQGRSSSPPS